MGGMITSLTSEFTTPPRATPMTTPIASARAFAPGQEVHGIRRWVSGSAVDRPIHSTSSMLAIAVLLDVIVRGRDWSGPGARADDTLGHPRSTAVRAPRRSSMDQAFRDAMTAGYALTEPGVVLGSPMLDGELAQRRAASRSRCRCSTATA